VPHESLSVTRSVTRVARPHLRVSLGDISLPMAIAVVVAVCASIILRILGTNGVVLVVAAIALAIVIALRWDELTALIIVVVGVVIDWYHPVDTPILRFPIVATILALFTIAMMLITRSAGRPWLQVPFLLLWVVLLVLALPAAFNSVYLPESLAYYQTDVILTPLLAYVIGVQVGRSVAHFHRLLAMLSGFATVVAVHTIVAALTGRFLLQTQEYVDYLQLRQNYMLAGNDVSRAGSFLKNPDWNGAFLAMFVFITFSLIISSKSRVTKVIYAVELMLLLAALLFTYSLASWGAVAVGLGIYLALVGRASYRVGLCLFIGVAVVTIVLAFPEQVGLLLGRTASQSGAASLTSRIAGWHMAIQVIRDHPLMGIGWGQVNYIQRGAPYRLDASAPADHPHESYLELAAMAGLPVLGAYLALLGGVVYRVLRKLRQSSVSYRALLVGVVAMAGVLAANSLGINGWTLPPIAAIAWLILGAAASPMIVHGRQDHAPRTSTANANSNSARSYGPEYIPVEGGSTHG
jgi:O-antigen ligase